MAIKFVPDDKGVVLEGREANDAHILNMLKCIFNKLNRVELQLEKLTDEAIDQDDGDIL
jgi:hypothetical protein